MHSHRGLACAFWLHCLDMATRGNTWEQHHVETISVEALRAAAASGLTDETFRHLQERLIQRGRHDAGSIGTEHDEE